MSRIWTCWLLGSSASLVLLICGIANAAIVYPDVMGNTVWYRNISEDSGTDPVPLYGAPSGSGNSLDFSPISFNSFSSGAGGNDITDGTLTMMIEAKPGNFIPKVIYDESGDFTLIGFGTNSTLASVESSFFIDIVLVDGNPILGGPISFALSMPIVPAAGLYQLATLGGGPIQQDNWNGNLEININAELAARGLPPRATKVTVTLDNTLTTLSEDGTSSFIAKKDFGGTTITVVPEPSCAILAGLGLLWSILSRAWRRAARRS